LWVGGQKAKDADRVAAGNARAGQGRECGACGLTGHESIHEAEQGPAGADDFDAERFLRIDQRSLSRARESPICRNRGADRGSSNPPAR